MRKLSDGQIIDIRRQLRANPAALHTLAAQYGVHPSTISHAACGRVVGASHLNALAPPLVDLRLRGAAHRVAREARERRLARDRRDLDLYASAELALRASPLALVKRFTTLVSATAKTTANEEIARRGRRLARELRKCRDRLVRERAS